MIPALPPCLGSLGLLIDATEPLAPVLAPIRLEGV